MISPQRYLVPEALSLENILQAIKAEFGIRKMRSHSSRQQFFDTFDWRLCNKSLCLHYDGKFATLASIAGEFASEKIALRRMPKFVRDLPVTPISNRLINIVEMRAFLTLFVLRIQTTPMGILNEDQKSVVDLDFVRTTVAHASQQLPLSPALVLRPVSGYESEAATLAHLLEKLDLRIETSTPFSQALHAIGLDQKQYSSKLILKLQPEQRADEAAKQIFRFLLEIVRHNEQGVLQDIDTEFLHDFRVAIRRTRSGLSQIKDVFSTEKTEKFKAAFAVIGKASNDLRDLDVYLLDAEQFKARVPLHMRGDIEPLFTQLHKNRARALRSVRQFLQSEIYHQTMADWQAFLEQPPSKQPDAKNALRPIAELASERIAKRHKRLIKDGLRIDDRSEDALLHALRIDAKKLRYLLEFFASLYKTEYATALLGQLKKLQGNLGHFQDLCVQEAELQQFIEKMSLRPKNARKTIAAIGCLIGALDREKLQVRAQFAKIFKSFASKKNKALLSKLLIKK